MVVLSLDKRVLQEKMAETIYVIGPLWTEVEWESWTNEQYSQDPFHRRENTGVAHNVKMAGTGSYLTNTDPL